MKALCVLLAVCWIAHAEDSGRFTAGLKLYRAGDCVGAIKKFEASASASEPSPERPFYHGVCLARQGYWERAEKLLSPWAHDHAADARAWYWLAQAHLYQKHFEQAKESIGRSLAIDGQSADAFRTLGEIELELKNHDAAYRAWLKAHQLNPRDERTDYYLGRLFFEADFLNEAAAWFREVLKLAPGHYASMTYLAQCAERMDMEPTAVSLYRAAIRESKAQGKPYSWAFVNLGKLLRQQGKDDEALAVLEESEKTCPEAHGLTILARILETRGENARAETILRRAIQMDSSIPDAHYRLALLLRASGRTSESEVEMRKFQDAKAVEEQNKVRIQAIRK